MTGDGDQRLKIILDELAQLAGLPPPPPIPPAQMASLGSAIDGLLAVLTAAGGVGIPGDNADAQQGQSEREAKINDALAKFPANEQQSAAQLAGIGQQSQPSQLTQMAQQLPQIASGIAGAISGALGGALQPLSQIPQQLSQAGQQAMQMGMGSLQHGTGSGMAAAEGASGDPLGFGDEFGGDGLADAAGAGSGGGAAWGGTTPTAILGPPPTPSAGTFPASSPAMPAATPSPPEPPAAPKGGMGAMPMMPPGAMHGSGDSGSGAKPDTKRIVAPSVKNGAPVQGRITTPPPTPTVAKRVEGKPVTTRRILLPDRKNDDDSAASH